MLKIFFRKGKIIGIISMVFLFALKAQANVITVNTLTDGYTKDGKCSLTEAVLSANQDKAEESCVGGNGADEINISVPGTIQLYKTLYLESDIKIRGNSAGTILDLQDAGSAMVLKMYNIEIANLEITGNDTGNEVIGVNDINQGEGDKKKQANILLKKLHIHNNKGTGIIYTKSVEDQRPVKVQVEDSVIENNDGKFGGGIYMDECSEPMYFSLYVNNSIIRNNSGGDYGGGIYNKCGHLVINNSTISGNRAKMGGGIFINAGKDLGEYGAYHTKTEIYNTTIAENEIHNVAPDDEKDGGGGDEKDKGDGEDGYKDDKMDNGKSEENEKDDGSQDEDDKKYKGELSYNNQNKFQQALNYIFNIPPALAIEGMGGGDLEGAGIYIGVDKDGDWQQVPEVIIKHSTIADNIGQGIFLDNGDVKISNTVVANNKDEKGGTVDQCTFYVKLNKNIGNVASDGSCGFKEMKDINLQSLKDNDGLELLGPTNNLGHILTMKPAESSPLIDKADKSECLETDARLISRPQGSGCDIGAHEVEIKNNTEDKEDEKNNKDTDGDGITDSEENEAPNGGDINKDGIPDIDQANITAFVNPIVDNYVALELKGGECTKSTKVSYYHETDLPTQDDQYDYPLGLHGDDIECGTIGGTATVVYYWDKKYDTSKWRYRKYLKNEKKYVDFSDQVTYGIAQVGDKEVTTVTFHITDGGPYDSDGTANGTIVDPAGPVIVKDGGSSIGNTVWLDENANGKQDQNEKGLENIRVKLIWYGPNGKYDHGKKDDHTWRTDTNHNGHYKFENLPKGKYKVIVKDEDVKDYIQTYDESGELNNQATVELKRNDNHTKADFGYTTEEWKLAKTGDNSLLWLIGLLSVLMLKIKQQNLNKKNNLL